MYSSTVTMTSLQSVVKDMLNTTTTRFYYTFEGMSVLHGLEMDWMRGISYVLGAYFVYRATLAVYRGRQCHWHAVLRRIASNC
jgi:hypothetical protein